MIKFLRTTRAITSDLNNNTFVDDNDADNDDDGYDDDIFYGSDLHMVPRGRILQLSQQGPRLHSASIFSLDKVSYKLTRAVFLIMIKMVKILEIMIIMVLMVTCR